MSNSISNGYGYWGPCQPGHGPNNQYGGWVNSLNKYLIPGRGCTDGGGICPVLPEPLGHGFNGVNLGVAGVGCNGGSVTNKDPGAGGYNAGAFSGTINNPSGPTNF